MKRKNIRKGFTIVELVIVIAVIAILATTLVPTFGNVIQNAKDTAAKQEAKNAYTTYMVANAGKGEMPEYMVYDAGDRFVALHNGAAMGVYGSAEEALRSMITDANPANLVPNGNLLVYDGDQDLTTQFDFDAYNQEIQQKLSANKGFSLYSDGSECSDGASKTHMIVSDYIRIPDDAVITKFAALAQINAKAYCVFYAEDKETIVGVYTPQNTDVNVYNNIFFGTSVAPEIPNGAVYIRVAYNAGFALGSSYPTNLDIANLGEPQLEFGPKQTVDETEVDLFVFAGQSNMQGSTSFAPTVTTFTNLALEYKYMPKLRGQETGNFVLPSLYTGECHYRDLNAAYGDKLTDLTYKSPLVYDPKGNAYHETSYFSPATYKNGTAFGTHSEENLAPSASLAPLFVTEYAENYGHSSIYAHMARGGTRIDYYFTQEMIEEYNSYITAYNSQNGTSYGKINNANEPGAGEAFDAKFNSMLEDYAVLNSDKSISNKCFVWLQGESDPNLSTYEYKLRMKVLWDHLQELGFTHFFVLRVGYWSDAEIINVIQAQEEFCAENEGCYIVTRAPSLIPHPNLTTSNWWIDEPSSEYSNCREYYMGDTSNMHFNEKAFQIFAERSAANVHRILHEGKEPILEEENIKNIVSVN